MSAPQPMTEAEYLAFERESSTKHEFIGGRLVAMVGASERHNLIVGNTLSAIHAHLRQRPCRVYPSDMRLQIAAHGQYTYPDISGLCGDSHLTDDHLDTYTNPLFIIEVLSPSTERHDRGAKFGAYKAIPSLQDYLLISQDTPQIEYFRRDGERWVYTDAVGLAASITVESIGCTLPLADVYDKISFEA